MTKQNTSIKRDLYQEVTNKMITLLEKGVAPWRCTWNKYGSARNYATGHRLHRNKRFFNELNTASNSLFYEL